MEVQKFIRFPVVKGMAGGVGRITLWRWVKAGLFPAPYRIGPNTSAWLEADVLAWIEAKKRGSAV